MLNAIIPFPNINPEIFAIDIGGFNLALRWYALAYIAGIIIGWRLILRAINTPRLWLADTVPVSKQQLEDLMTWIIIGIIVGGRLGFVTFYQPAYYLANPVEILMVWQGGMAFHGGFLGVVVAVWLFSRRHSLNTASMADTLAFAAPAGLLLGRIANFIKPELWGRPSDVPWAVIFPGDRAQDCPGIEGLCARHPSQLYEAGLEGLVLGLLLLFLVWRRDWLKTPGQTAGLFFIGYGISRFIVEFFREADAQFIGPDNPLGFVIGSGSVGLSMGQLLSLPMILVGIGTIIWARRKSRQLA
ncbi:MAG: prolipoprotein diacylglyceryl transferase [Marinosulfonomonas sp.]|nr:MAG: prolipoprotein diacylglyceryl transferase [Marinosulfonomonas sp.]